MTVPISVRSSWPQISDLYEFMKYIILIKTKWTTTCHIQCTPDIVIHMIWTHILLYHGQNAVVLHVIQYWIKYHICRVCIRNSLRLRQNGRQFTGDILSSAFILEWNAIISIKISMSFVPKGPINSVPALVRIMDWRRTGDKPLYEPMIA